MGSLTSCLTKAAKTVSRDDADAMQATAENFRREGVAPDAAGVQAIEAQLQTAVDEANEFAGKVNEQFGTKVSFELNRPAPETRADSNERLATTAERAGKTMRVGRVVIVGSVPTDFANLINGWLDKLGADTTKAAEAGIPSEVMLVDLPEFRARTGSTIGVNAQGVASHYYTKADGVRVAFIGIDMDGVRARAAEAFLIDGEQQGETALIETVAHELGHVIERSMFSKLPEADQQQVIDAYMRWLARVEGMPNSKAALERLTKVRGAMLANAKRQGDMNPGWDQLTYSKGWREWSADNIARWLLSDAEPQGVVDRFFSRVAAEIRKVFARLTGAPMPNPDIADVMRRMVARATAWREGADLGGVGTMNAKAYQARMARVLGGNDTEVDASLDPKTVEELDLNAEPARRAIEEMDAAIKRADNSTFSLTRGLANLLRGKSDNRLKQAGEVARDSLVGTKWDELKFALMSRLQIATLFDDRKDVAFATAARLLNDADRRAEQLSAEQRAPFDEIFRRIDALAPRARAILNLLMHDSTMVKIRPDVPFDHPANKHLGKSEAKRKQHAALAMKFRLATDPKYGGEPEIAKLYRELLAKSTRLNRRIARKQIKLAENEIKQIERDAGPEGLSKAKQAEINALRGQIKQLATQRLESSRGPWFPLRRRGDFIVKVPLPEDIIKDKGDVDFVTEEAAERAAKRARTANPNDSVRVNKRVGDNGELLGYDVRVSRNGVFFFESLAAARASKDDMIATVKSLWEELGTAAGSFDEWYEKNGDTAFNAKKVSDTYFSDKEVPGSVLEKMRKLKGEGLPPSVVEAFQTMALEADAQYTLNASALPRRNVIGASHDMTTAMAEWVYGASYNYGNITEAKGRRDAWKTLNKLANDISDDRRSALRRSAYNALAANDKLTAERRALTGYNTAANFVSRLSSLMSLAFSPAYVAINATQPHVVGTPLLAAQTIKNADGTYSTLGIAEAGRFMLDAMRGNKGVGYGLWATTRNGGRDFVQHLRSFAGKETKGVVTPEQMFEQILTTYARGPQEEALLKTLRDQGDLDFGHLAALQDTLASSKVERKWNDALRMGMAFAQHVETMNRTVTALAAYRAATERLGYDKVINLNGAAASLDPPNKTLRFVTDFVNESMINYSMVNRPNVFKYQFMGPILQFKMYVQGIYAMFIRHGALALSGDAEQRAKGWAAMRNLLATHAVMAGAIGLGPLAAVAKMTLWAGAMAFGDDEDKWKDDETLLHEFVKDHFGDGVLGTAVERGVPAALLNMDLSSRAGLPNLLDTRFLNLREDDTPKGTVDKVALYALGPVYGSISRLLGHGTATLGESIDFLQGESDSDDVLREFAKASPTGLRSLIDAVQYTRNGVMETDGDRFIQPDDLSSYDVFVRALGLTPTEVGKSYERRSREFSTMGNITKEREDVMSQYNMAKNRGTPDDMIRARQRIRDFNRVAPDEFKIRPDQASQSAASQRERESGVVDKRRQAVRDDVLE